MHYQRILGNQQTRIVWGDEALGAAPRYPTNFPRQKDKEAPHAPICKPIRRATKTTFGGVCFQSQGECWFSADAHNLCYVCSIQTPASIFNGQVNVDR